MTNRFAVPIGFAKRCLRAVVESDAGAKARAVTDGGGIGGL